MAPRPFKGAAPRQLSLSFLWGPPAASEAPSDEPVRRAGAEALAALAPEPVRPAGEPGQLLLEPRERDPGEGRGAEPGPGGGRPTRGELPAEAQTPQHGAAERRVAGPEGDGVSGAGG